ncbi:uncharacterized protein LOC106150616 isoform X2 [Lingula anatina]|uniref:Uncharacterized protein LOC106150616 isoform X2 n=1 Tax=Lingula anatina TaxID=7574 RepID=A0A1S3H0H0_LINAN|nr:uncharacterized protein LOC106150616 isoform X2 [Lingula anatina]|eukprot:XP_013378976.1 uncharacterized protein LOC106150616 isoform X2 [Lingula anatina]
MCTVYSHQPVWVTQSFKLQAKDGDIERLQHLLTAGHIDINEQAWGWSTLLHCAAGGGRTQCVQLLLQHGADTDIQDKLGRTPLHCAADHGYTQCVQLLLQHGADTSIQDWFFMRTPLHWAASGGHIECVQLLLQHGSDTSIQDKEKKTPRMLAEEKEHIAVVELLRRFEVHDIQLYIQTRTLEHLAEILGPEEYGIFNLTNFGPNFPDLFQFQKIQGVKDWVAKNNYTTVKDIRDGLLAANRLRLSRAAVEYYTQVVINISNMPPDEFETLCRTLTTAKYMHQHTPSSTTRGLKSASLPLDQYRQDAFIAHSEEDESTIEPVLLQLKESGIQCWYDKEDLIPGTYVIYETVEAISASMFSILFLSKSFIQSGRCKFEMENIIRNATEKEHGVIPVVMNITPEEFPDGLRNWKHFFFDDQELVSKILAVIKGPKVIPTYGQLRQENGILRDENEVLRDEVRKLTDKLRLQSQ